MATIANNNCNSQNLIKNDKNEYVSVNDYNKLKSKYDNKVKENKKLKEYLENIMVSYESINQSKKSVEEIFEMIKDMIKNNKFFAKCKEEFSTSYTQYEFLGAADMKTSAKSSNCSFTNSNLKDYLNQNILKKIEEMENSYNEICKNFNLLTSKYQLVKEDNKKLEENNITLLDQISSINEEYKHLYKEFNEANITIERFKEIDKCLVDSTINSLFLNSSRKKQFNCNNSTSSLSNKDEVNKMVSYVLCEPVPTFVKFINKFTK